MFIGNDEHILSFLFTVNQIIVADIEYFRKSLDFDIGYISFVCFDTCNYIFIHIITSKL